MSFVACLHGQLLHAGDLQDWPDLTRNLSECNMYGNKDVYKAKEIRVKQFLPDLIILRILGPQFFLDHKTRLRGKQLHLLGKKNFRNFE